MIDLFKFSLDIADWVGERSRSRSVADRQYPTPMNPIFNEFDSVAAMRTTPLRKGFSNDLLCESFFMRTVLTLWLRLYGLSRIPT
jgi:hypothetical protein